MGQNRPTFRVLCPKKVCRLEKSIQLWVVAVVTIMRCLRERSKTPPISLSLLYLSLSADDLLIEGLADVLILMILNLYIHNKQKKDLCLIGGC